MKKNLFLLFIFTICSTTMLYPMDVPADQPAPAAQNDNPAGPAAPQQTPQDRYYNSQADYFDVKTRVELQNEKMNNDMSKPEGQIKQQAIKEGVAVAARLTESGIRNGFDAIRKKLFGLSEDEQIDKQSREYDRDYKKESAAGVAAANAHKTKEGNVLDKQELNYEIDAVEKLAGRLPGGWNNPEVKKRWKELAKRAGLELPEEKKSDKKQKDKKGFFAKLASPIVLVATKAGETADLLASYSFAYITNHDYFKDTVIGKNAQNINRTLVALTTLAICYGGYKVYKNKFSGEYDADDFFDNDEE